MIHIIIALFFTRNITEQLIAVCHELILNFFQCLVNFTGKMQNKIKRKNFKKHSEFQFRNYIEFTSNV